MDKQTLELERFFYYHRLYAQRSAWILCFCTVIPAAVVLQTAAKERKNKGDSVQGLYNM